MEVSDAIRPHLQRLVGDLVYGRFESMTVDGRNGRLTADEIRTAIGQYPGQITMPPSEAFERLDMRQVRTAAAPTYYIHFDLWLNGVSNDLTLSCAAVLEHEPHVALMIENLHVM